MWLYLTALSTACVALLRRAIAESDTLSKQMANYVDNGKRQEQAADNAAAVQR
jgi:hypothetical protein